MEIQFKLNVAVLSIDDFYLTRQERELLAEQVHPLLKTRGVPGTHDVKLALAVIEQLRHQSPHQSSDIPRFDKAIDDRAQTSDWDQIQGSVDVIILEGWCTGLSAQNSKALLTPVNELEAQEDTTGIWREYVNQQLANQYRELFEQIDNLIVLKAPSFASVYQWRLLQEQKLIEKIKLSDSEQMKSANNKTMSPKEITRFISHYQRLTEHAIDTLPSKADWLLTLGDNHQIKALTLKDSSSTAETKL